jgi:hypothetical protein
MDASEELLGRAIARTLQAPPPDRVALFERLASEITILAAAPDSGMKPWTCASRTGTDGSRIFSGGIGYSIVIDPRGRMWRAGTHEDFETTWEITPTSCEVSSMSPKYGQMREYLPRGEAAFS